MAAIPAAPGVALGHASVGEAFVFTTTAEAVPDHLLVVGNLLAVPGTEALLYRLKEVRQPGTAPDSKVYVLDNLVKQEEKAYTAAELANIRPLGVLVPDRPWDEYAQFVEGGYYQAWPSGKLYIVRHGFLVDVSAGVRTYGVKPEDKKALPKMIPLFIKRFEPSPTATPTTRR